MLARLLRPSGSLASLARRSCDRLGLKIQRCPSDSTGIDAFRDMRRLVDSEKVPLIIDVGANVGQSVQRFKDIFPSGEIHSFEPSPSAYSQLSQNVTGYSNVHTINCGLGSDAGEAVLLENVHSDMSSFLPPGPLAWGHIARETPVRVDTLGNYSDRHGLRPINILKIDTQGSDLEVVKGAKELIRKGRIQMVYMEVIFSDMYENLPPPDVVFGFMRGQGFKLVSLYTFNYQEGLASWSDALFLHPAFGSLNGRARPTTPRRPSIS